MNLIEVTLPSILVVDDCPGNLMLIEKMLKDQYKIQIANNGIKAIELATANPPDLILLDVMMPSIDGYETCRQLKTSNVTKSIPIIFLTSKNAAQDEEAGLLFGAVDFVRKPVSAGVLHARVRTHLGNKAWLEYVEKKNTKLEKSIMAMSRDISRLEGVAIDVMALSAFEREDRNHYLRVQQYVKLLALKLSEISPEYTHLDEDSIEILSKSALLYDIGKIATPGLLQHKQQALTKEESTVLRSHTLNGYDVLRNASAIAGGNNNFLICAANAALSHHEHWNGSGYPNGLSGNDIPLIGRLIALADAYDTHRRGAPDQALMSYDEVVTFITEKKGSYFDPDITDVFLLISDQFEQLLNEVSDNQNEKRLNDFTQKCAKIP
ncbi:two-component system response regulator [Undibacterium rugosum]|uniref:response regulator n=1 Tax=Undibacterium rugosum TaxID=2762291 RepID=UPI001B815ACD|nr:response regulator [Undibacterium rugosum]MBR7780218.1 response regulator [Undibacterium rugosum]